MTSPSFSPVLLQPSNISHPSSGSTMGPAADWDGNPDEADSSRIDRAAGFLLPLLRSGASGLISCCRPPLWPARRSSQSEESLGSNFAASPVPCAYEKPGNNAEHWEQLTLSLFLCLATKIANEPLRREKQNKCEQWNKSQTTCILIANLITAAAPQTDFTGRDCSSGKSSRGFTSIQMWQNEFNWEKQQTTDHITKRGQTVPSVYVLSIRKVIQIKSKHLKSMGTYI